MHRIIALISLSLGVIVLAVAPAHSQAKDSTALADSAKAKTKPDLGPTRRIEFETDEGTWMSVDVSPDGKTLLFDLLGDLYTLPITGGDAKLLMGGRAWDHMSRFSRDGKSIAFISDRDGNMNLWVANADGTNATQVTKESRSPVTSPTWSPDGTILVRKEVKWGTEELWAFYQEGGTGYKIPISGRIFGPTVSPDGRFLFVSGMRRFDRITGDSIELGSGVRPKVSPDGRFLAYALENDHLTALHLRDLKTGLDRRLVSAITPMAQERRAAQDRLPDYAFTPDGRSIVLSIGGKLARVSVATGEVATIPFRARVSQEVSQPITRSRRVPDGDLQVRVIRWPLFSRDLKRVVFGALGKVYVAELPEGKARRITNATEREYTPAFSPDGRWIAYTTWNDTTLGHVLVVPAAGGKPRRLTTLAGRYVNPVWSRDGRKLAFLRGGGVEQRGGQPESETYLDMLWLPIEGGEPRFITSMSSTSSMRYYPVIAFNPDGTRVFYSQRIGHGDEGRAVLYSLRLDGTDKRTHLKVPLNDEIVPSPDGSRVAFVRREQVFVAVLPQLTLGPVDVNFDSPSVPLKRLTKYGGNYVSWLDSNTVAWVHANRLFREKFEIARLDSAKVDSAKADTATIQPFAEITLTVAREKPAGKIAFTNARLITMKGDEVIERGTIVVDRNRIVAVGPSASVQVARDATVVDATGTTIMPGLNDVHAHMHYNAYEVFPQQKWEYVVNLAYGVTTTFDPSAHNLDVFAQSEMVEAGEMLGPRIFSTGDVIYGIESGFTDVYEKIESIEDARSVVKRFKAYDATMLKQYMQPRRDQRQWLAQAAREEGVLLTAEGASDLVLDLTMVADGYTAFEHSLPVAPLYKDVIEFVARSKVHYTPTLIISYGGPGAQLYFASRNKIHDDPKLRRFTPENTLDYWRRWQYVPDEEQHFIRVSEAAAQMTKRGGNVSLGAHGNQQGLGAQWELWALHMGGLTNLEAIRAGTLTPAIKLGYEQDLGSLEVGKLADFLVLTANPLEDIRNSAKLRYTVKNGLVYDAESMTQLWPTRKPLGRFFWQRDEEAKKFAAPVPKALQ